jgi:hypothetical protein
VSIVQTGLRSIEVDDQVVCPDCGHGNHLLECMVQGWTHERRANETEIQFLDRFFGWNDAEGSGEVECRCGLILYWESAPGSMDVTRVE